MDPLSDVLSLIRVQSLLSARVEGYGPWALRFPAYRQGQLKFGSVMEGDRWLWVDGTDDVVQLAPGDFYLLTDGRPYCFASTPDAPLRESIDVMPSHPDEDGVVRFGQGASRTVGAGGRFMLDDDAGRLLLDSLPPVLHIKAEAQDARALEYASKLIWLETERSRPGAAAMAGSLANLVLVNILRAYLAGGHAQVGWLGALADAKVGQALRLMHGEVARRWTVADLASAVAMSRTSFSERFRTQVGTPPLEYLTRWRLMLARNALKTGTEPLGSIARQIGYESDTAFSLAFKRAYGISPGRYRTAKGNDS